MSARDEVIEAIKSFGWDRYGDDTLTYAIRGTGAAWPVDLADAVMAALDPEPFHTIDVGTHGWTLKHPLDCRDDLFNCPTNQLAEQLDGPPAPPGRYRVDLVEGLLAIGESVPVGSSGSSSGSTS